MTMLDQQKDNNDSRSYTQYQRLTTVNPSISSFIRANSPISNNVIEDRIKLLGKSQYPAYTTAALLAAQIPRSLRHASGSPSLIGCITFGAIFAGAGWIVTKDDENGSGTLTAWSLAYLLLLGGRTIKSRHPLPILATTSVVFNALVYSKRYFGW